MKSIILVPCIERMHEDLLQLMSQNWNMKRSLEITDQFHIPGLHSRWRIWVLTLNKSVSMYSTAFGLQEIWLITGDGFYILDAGMNIANEVDVGHSGERFQ